MKDKKIKKVNPDKIGIAKFWAWQMSGVSMAANFIIVSGFITIYCTNVLGLSPVLVGMLLMGSKILDGFLELFAGLLIDRTNTRWGKGRPYEFAVIFQWIATILLFSTPGDASATVKSIWIVATYFLINSVFETVKSAANNAYTIRAFKTHNQIIKIASYGGIVIMICSIIVNISFPILQNRIATSPQGWTLLMTIISIPMIIIGMLRFFIVKETVKVEDNEGEDDKATLKDILSVLKHNKYVYMIAVMFLVYNMVTGMGIMSYFFTYIVGNIELMGTAGLFSIIVLPLLFFFPMIIKKLPIGRLVVFGCVAYVIAGILLFAAGSNYTILIISFIFTGIAVLPITYLTDIMLLDCATFNEWKNGKRMDGTLASIKNFAGKLGTGFGSLVVGLIMGMSGFDGSLEVQPEAALLSIRALQGLVPAVLFTAVAIMMWFYKLDKIVLDIRKDKENQTISQS